MTVLMPDELLIKKENAGKVNEIIQGLEYCCIESGEESMADKVKRKLMELGETEICNFFFGED